ncbi:MAG: hypothetical protein SVP26_05520 [Chloroflexota bacterium]|nr:hypothetical protein [Chloroflexota bacterium]
MNGYFVTAAHWNPDDPATPVLIPAMLDDIGIEDGPAREAARRFCIASIEETNAFCEPGSLRIGALQYEASAFLAGYQACLAEQ